MIGKVGFLCSALILVESKALLLLNLSECTWGVYLYGSLGYVVDDCQILLYLGTMFVIHRGWCSQSSKWSFPCFKYVHYFSEEYPINLFAAWIQLLGSTCFEYHYN